ncbi:hypothetical protein [Sedimentibacter sp.]|uniref:ABC transporter permease n=1 Tax=Sedimentibacter sp. TaxID=1960295 RepID=UPI000EC0DEC6|nr:hypothetical protein [Sedimentibacter sp.]HCX61572.1 hypothetical protein [Clostridiales bacterium]
MKSLDFQGTVALLRLYLKKDRIKRSIWMLTPALLAMSAYSSYINMFASAQELSEFVNESILNPVVAAIHGFILTKDIPGLVSWNIKTVSLIIAAIFNILTMTKTTRGEEENGRTDVLCSCVIGRQAQLAAASIICLCVNFLMGILLTLTMAAFGMDFTGSLGMGLLIAVGSSLFTAIAAVTSQLTPSRRGASSIAMAVFGVFYVISFFNNLTTNINISSYITPFRWFFILRPFDSNSLGILFAALLAVVSVFAAALKLSSVRDIGDGIIPHRAGKADAPAYLRNTWALSLRMHRGAFISWTVVLFIFALGIGSVDALVAEMLENVPALASWMSLFGEPEDAFLALMIFVMSLFAAAYGIIAALRVRAEESEQYVDALLSATTTRNSLMGSHAVFSVAGTVLIAFVIGIGVILGKAMSGGFSTGDWAALSAALYKLPAIWVTGGIVVLLIGLIPRFSTAISWSVFALFIGLQLFWEMGILPETAFLLSPFGHVYPTRPQTALTFIILTIVALALYTIGFTGFRKRDIQQ